MPETMGDRIRMHRARLRLSQTALGERVGLSANAVSQLEKGEVEPRAVHLKALAKALGVSSDYLLGLTRQSDPRETEPAMPVPVPA
jgi:XRE family transcriptional regulator, fatty acid utilization regulator